jgi:cysteinyl-tRNA synthetase
LNYSDQHLDDAKAALNRLYTALRGLSVEAVAIDWQQSQAASFKVAMDDDFNTPEALAVLFDLANEVNKTKSLGSAALLKALAGLIGLLQRDPDEYLQGQANANISADEALNVDQLIIQRNEAKQSKNFAEADRIRKLLAEAGIILEDSPLGTTWRRA